MSSLNYREAVRAKLISSGVLGNDAYVVVAGPANSYSHYVTTREEYGVQRYEGASTIFGPCKYLIFFLPFAGTFGPFLNRAMVETHFHFALLAGPCIYYRFASLSPFRRVTDAVYQIVSLLISIVRGVPGTDECYLAS